MTSVALAYRELVDTDYSKLRRRLLATKGGSTQTDFLKVAKRSRNFVDYISSRVEVQGSRDLALATEPMTESEFRALPSDTEARLYMSWSDLSPQVACRSTFWANLTLCHIREQRIRSVYLAANGGNLAGGAERIDRALNASGDERLIMVDGCVRTILRRLGGIPEVRGKRTVYVDCPFARAWWREWLVTEVTEGNSNLARQVRQVVRINQTYWEKIVDRMVSRNSTFGSRNVRTAFILTLSSLAIDLNSELRKTKHLNRACRRIAAHQATRELSVLSDAELGEIMTGVLAPDKASSTS